MGNDPRWNAAGTRVHVGGSVVEFQRWLARHDAEVLRSAALDAESDADSDDHDPTTMRVCRAWSQWLKDRADRVEQGRQAAAAPVPDAEDDTLRDRTDPIGPSQQERIDGMGNDPAWNAAINALPGVEDDTLREHLAQTISDNWHGVLQRHHNGTSTLRTAAQNAADALLPLIREHVERAAEQARAEERGRADRAERWLDEIDQAAGAGSVTDVANHQRKLGVQGDHEARLRAKRVKKIVATVMEETEWRREVLNEWQVRAEQAEAAIERVQALRPRTASGMIRDFVPYADIRAALDGSETP